MTYNQPYKCYVSLLFGVVSSLLRLFYCAFNLFQYGVCEELGSFSSFPNGRDQRIVPVLSLEPASVRKGGPPVAVPFIVQPLSFVLQSVRSVTDPVTHPFVSLPLSKVPLDESAIFLFAEAQLIVVDLDCPRPCLDVQCLVTVSSTK